MIYYSTGFLFTPLQGEVALIRKARPEWQQNLLNGIGGHIEDNETSYCAMVREFEEETHLQITEWQQFCELVHRGTKCDWTVFFFKAFTPLGERVLGNPTDEKVAWYPVHDLSYRQDIVPNLRWLIPMALEGVSATVTQIDWPHPI